MDFTDVDGRRYISIHTPLAGSDYRCVCYCDSDTISIHTPLAGSDLVFFEDKPPLLYFNPHSPRGE